MKTKIALAVILLTARIGLSQGFINLNFESATIKLDTSSPYYPNAVYASNAIPGWTAYTQNTPQNTIFYNDQALDATWVSLLSTNYPLMPISGKYGILLQGGDYPPGGIAATISQTGLVSASAVTLLFEAQQYGVGTLQVTLGGQNLPYFALAAGSNYTLYGADISAFAGETETLSFSALENNGGGQINNWLIDNIQFSSTPVPEPSALILVALGATLLSFCIHRRKSTA